MSNRHSSPPLSSCRQHPPRLPFSTLLEHLNSNNITPSLCPLDAWLQSHLTFYRSVPWLSYLDAQHLHSLYSRWQQMIPPTRAFNGIKMIHLLGSLCHELGASKLEHQSRWPWDDRAQFLPEDSPCLALSRILKGFSAVKTRLGTSAPVACTTIYPVCLAS